MIYLDCISAQASNYFETSGDTQYDADMLVNWVIRSWSGVGNLVLELAIVASEGSLLERSMCRLVLAHWFGKEKTETWRDFVRVLNCTEEIVSDETCSICLETIDRGVKLDCRHEFHGHCIQKWFNHSATCPVCRFEII